MGWYGGGQGSQSGRDIRQFLAPRYLARGVMASPPTMTWGTTNLVSSSRLWPPVYSDSTNASGHAVVQTTPFSVTGAFNPVILGLGFPSYLVVRWQSVNYGGGTFANNFVRIGFQYQGSHFAAGIYGSGGAILARIDGQFVSLTPQTVPNDGNFYYWDFNFGSYGTHEIEIFGSNLYFFGLYTAQTDTVSPSALRGPKVAVVSDSFGEGTGASIGGSISDMWFTAMLELGWNNVYFDAVGATGLLANASGSRLNYYDRFVGDVAPLVPDLIIAQMSINDASFTATQVANQAVAFFNQAKQYCPNSTVLFTGEMLNSGATVAGPGLFNRVAQVQAAVTAAGALFTDVSTTPLQGTPLTNSLAANASIGATSLSLNAVPLLGGHYVFADGTRFMVKAISGTGPTWTVTTDDGGIQTAELAGATLTQVGDSPVTGHGHQGATTGWGNADNVIWTDGTHPSQFGHDMYGEIHAKQIYLTLESVA